MNAFIFSNSRLFLWPDHRQPIGSILSFISSTINQMAASIGIHIAQYISILTLRVDDSTKFKSSVCLLEKCKTIADLKERNSLYL